MKSALIVSPYLDHLGGGERYMLSAAVALRELGYTITFGWDTRADLEKLASQLGLELGSYELAPHVIAAYHAHSPLTMYRATRPYDVVFYLSDGSLPLLGGRTNLVHMQVPFHDVHGQSWTNKIKKMTLSRLVVNSAFTKRVVDQEYGVDAAVLYPPVPMHLPLPKKPLILSVGRFEPSLNVKKQTILIEAFKALSRELPDWELVLAGGSADPTWLATLKSQAAGFPIRFAANCSHKELVKLYGEATLYWHAAGYGVDEVKQPELTEHFGISTVEAISAQALPLVVPRGGQREIIQNPALTWDSIPELVEKTVGLAHNRELRSSLLHELSAEPYTEAHFRQNLAELLV